MPWPHVVSSSLPSCSWLQLCWPPIAIPAVSPPADAQLTTFDLQAHRGGRGETTEESLRAFSKSLELGVSTLELDVVITKDGQPLVWHDPTIQPDKCADTAAAFAADPQYLYVGKLVHDLTLAQIRTLDCGKLLNDFPDAEVVAGNKIATLPQVFALTDSYAADARYNIETKVEADKPDTSASPREFVDVILAAVRSAGKVDRVEIQSFDWRTLPVLSRTTLTNSAQPPQSLSPPQRLYGSEVGNQPVPTDFVQGHPDAGCGCGGRIGADDGGLIDEHQHDRVVGIS